MTRRPKARGALERVRHRERAIERRSVESIGGAQAASVDGARGGLPARLRDQFGPEAHLAVTTAPGPIGEFSMPARVFTYGTTHDLNAIIECTYMHGANTFPAEADVVKTYDLGANCYLSKPVDMEQFVRVVQAVDDATGELLARRLKPADWADRVQKAADIVVDMGEGARSILTGRPSTDSKTSMS